MPTPATPDPVPSPSPTPTPTETRIADPALAVVPTRAGDTLAVDPAALADAGRRLRLVTGGGSPLAGHARGPRPTPDSGDEACTAAYARAAHQLAGLIGASVVRNDALGGALGRAGGLYAVLDAGGLGGETLADVGGDAA